MSEIPNSPLTEGRPKYEKENKNKTEESRTTMRSADETRAPKTRTGDFPKTTSPKRESHQQSRDLVDGGRQKEKQTNNKNDLKAHRQSNTTSHRRNAVALSRNNHLQELNTVGHFLKEGNCRFAIARKRSKKTRNRHKNKKTRRRTTREMEKIRGRKKTGASV